MKIPRKLNDTPDPSYGALRRNPNAIQIVRTSPRLVVLKRAYRQAGKQWKGERMSFEDWYQKVVEFQRSEGHTVR